MTRKTLDPKKLTIAWRRAPLGERIQACKAMLAIHGFLTTAESERVQKRIEKWKSAETTP